MTISAFSRLWHAWTPNGGFVHAAEQIQLGINPTPHHYSDGQLDDYGHDRVLRWNAPATLELEARFNLPFADFRGTAGFGWWNDPAGTGTRHLRLPRAAWFFGASDQTWLEFAPHTPRNGWLAMTLDAATWRFWTMLPFVPIGLILMQMGWWQAKLMPVIQWMVRVQMRSIEHDWTAWHRYRIEWLPESVRCWVDDELVLNSRWSPRGAMGLVLWVDNQYAIVKPNGVLRGGILDHQTQWLEIRQLNVASNIPKQ